MLTKSLSSAASLARKSPPNLKPSLPPEVATPVDCRAAREPAADQSLRKTLLAMASLAASLAPQLAHAVEPPEVAQSLQETTTLESLKQGVESLKESAGRVASALDPNGYLKERESKVGDYDFRFKPMDMDLKPRLKSGKPGLRFRGELLETSLSKTETLPGGWSSTQGVNARLWGEATTYSTPNVDLEMGVFREYRGTVAQDFQAKFRAEAGVRQRFLGEDEGLKAGINFRQEIEGGRYQAFGTTFSLYVEGRQSAYKNLDDGVTELSYQFMAGPKKDFDLSVFGHKGKLTVTVGPEVRGSSRGDSFDLGLGSKVRARF